MAVARKHSVLSDGCRSCKVTYRREDDGRSSQELSLIRWLPLEIPRPSSLSHHPTAAAYVKSLTGGSIMAVARKHSVLSDGPAHVNSLTGGRTMAIVRKHSVLPDGRHSKSYARAHSVMIRRPPLMQSQSAEVG